MDKSIFIKFMMSLLIVVLISGMFYSTSSHAMGEIISSGKSFLSKGNSIQSTIDTTALETASSYIYNILLAIAIVVAVVVAMVLGIQFMVASADEKAKVKEALMPFVVGCIVVFGSFTIWKVAVNIGNEAEGEIKTVDEQRKENHEQFERIENGEIDEFTDQEIRDAYTANWVSDDLVAKMKVKADPRSGGNLKKGTDYGLTLEQALEKLSTTKRSIYDEAKARGLLDDSEDRIYEEENDEGKLVEVDYRWVYLKK